ncbi:E3 ubiquitin-protein ligase RNF169 [Dunckerocampus dactyliophorus]|uniref:E3 ubiquitin-protein ligase RNF169 n=1 Tax=Dunckerocampus dactyliophorus TaxID=161453 RepID=UPI00240603A5|nr:E3 ubiquitin-protein ligase RNF169 [Dunckerocampus dactyliophorus]
MAASGSVQRSGKATDAGESRSGTGLGIACGSAYSCPPAHDTETPVVCEHARSAGSPPCSGHGRRRTEAERSGGEVAAKDAEHRRGPTDLFICPSVVQTSAEGPNMKHKLPVCEDREEMRRRSLCRDEPGVLSDSENEVPIGRRIRTLSAFVRRTRTSSGITRSSQRSRSCTLEHRGGKLKLVSQVAMLDRVGVGHSFTAGILLSSENSRSVSAPASAPERRPAWRTAMTSSATPLSFPQFGAERSISPESNDSISEELNHFKPIVCSPCTPPKRLADGRLLEPTIVKSTPRNLTSGLTKPTSYETSPAVLQRWRQIELDRQSFKVNSKATLTSPIKELQDSVGVSSGGRSGTSNKRKLVFDPPNTDGDAFQKQTVKIRVPAVRYSSEVTFRGSSEFETTVGVPELRGGGALFGRRHSFSPYAHKSGFQSCKMVPKDSSSPRKESDSGVRYQTTTSKRSRKSHQKTKHLDQDRDSDRVAPEVFDEHLLRTIRQERRDRALAVKLQRQFDRESDPCRTSPDKYFLRSWMSNQNRRRRGLRRSRRINKQR